MAYTVKHEGDTLVVYDESGQRIASLKPEDLPEGVKAQALIWALSRVLRESNSPFGVIARWQADGQFLGTAGRPADVPSLSEIRKAFELLGLSKEKQESLENRWVVMNPAQKKEAIKTNKALKKALDAVRLQAESIDFEF